MYHRLKKIFKLRKNSTNTDATEIVDGIDDIELCNIPMTSSTYNSMNLQISGNSITMDTVGLPSSVPISMKVPINLYSEASISTQIQTPSYFRDNLIEEITEFYHQFPDLHTEVRVLIANDVTIYLLGTNHADPQCPIDVANIMKKVQPQTALIELCAWRACACKKHRGNIFQTKPEFTFRYLRKVIKQIGFLPAMIFFTDAFNEHTAIESYIDYGGEFAVAAQLCAEMGNCKIVLADREIPITVRRQASAMGNWRGLKISFFVTISLMMKGLLRNFLTRGHKLVIRDPSFYQIVVLERDIFLTYMIQSAATLPYKEKRPQVVAVVGQGHLNGIQTFWGKVVPQILPIILEPEIA